ncbi:MAG: hypothetical protein MUO31_00800 [Thermodesulfovibrionales bacterium]|nr:hypothetical protein [Thermodesulfovibrionales bacterium]
MTEEKKESAIKKQRKLINCGIILFSMLVGFAYLLMNNCSDNSSKSFESLGTGEMGRLVSEGGGTITLAIDKEALKEMIKTVLAKDRPGFNELYYAGKIFYVDSNTRVNVIDRAVGLSRVRILEGPQKDNAGWCDYKDVVK